MIENTVLDALKTRRSIRKYKPEQITEDELKAVLEAGTYAPTGMGLPEGLIGIGAIALGYPEVVPQHAKARKENYYRIIK